MLSRAGDGAGKGLTGPLPSFGNAVLGAPRGSGRTLSPSLPSPRLASELALASEPTAKGSRTVPAVEAAASRAGAAQPSKGLNSIAVAADARRWCGAGRRAAP